MERIKKAFEKAYGQPEAAGIKAAVHPSSRTNIRLGEVNYTRTRSIDLDDEVLAENRIITSSSSTDEIESAYAILRTKILHRLRENHWNSVAIVSPGAGEGKSLTAINLAISVAREVKHSVLLVDFDLRKPSIHKLLGYTVEYGVEDYICNGTPLHEILFNPGIERLVVLPSKTGIANSSECLSSPKIIELVEELKSRYPERIIIFDLPPLLSVDDALAFSPYVESMLLVIEEGRTESEALHQSLDVLQGSNILGSVLNKSDDTTMLGY